MIEKKEIVNSGKQLLQARENGLKQVQQVDAMQAHGKILGMDTFSWMNPHVDLLATLLSSFPFSVLWIGTRRQIEACMHLYPELSENIETILIHDDSVMDMNISALQKIKTIACVQGVENAFEFMKSMKLKKGVLMYTNENQTAVSDKKIFEEFVEMYK